METTATQHEKPQIPTKAWGRLKFFVSQTFTNWSDDKASTWAASLAFYTMLSLGPLLFVVVAACGLVFGEEASHGAVMSQVQNLLGDSAADTIATMMQQANQPGHRGVLATVFGLVTLIFGASGVFSALQEAMDAIWHVQPKPKAGIWSIVRRRFLSMSMIVGVGFMLTVSLVTSSGLAAIQKMLTHAVPLGGLLALAVDFIVSTAFFTLFFSAVFKVLPDAQVRWRDTWIGGAVTAVLFNIGKVLIGLYLGRSNITTSYGAAGSLALVLLWVYYAAQIVFLGAEFVRVYAQATGNRLQPARDAMAVETVEAAQGDRQTA